MADTKSPTNQDKMRNDSSQGESQTLRHEQAKGEVSGGSDRGEKSAIGGGSDDTSAKTGEAGRARNELDENKGQFDKSRSEPTGQR